MSEPAPTIRAALERFIELGETAAAPTSIPIITKAMWFNAIAAAEAALEAEPEGPTLAEEALCALERIQHGDASSGSDDFDLVANALGQLRRYDATPPAPEQGQGRWTEGVCGDGAAILFDGAMVPIEEVVRALNGRPTPPVPELLEANFRAWHKEARGSLYYGAMPLCDAIEWAQHLLQQVTLQALVSPAAPAPPITEPSALPELVRYGFIGDGPNRPLLVWSVDGYWTPWHIAATLLQQQQAELATLRGVPVAVSERIISIAKAVQECAFTHEPDARLIGNVCAEDVADLCTAALATPPVPQAGEVEA